jgi:hypothetical protein
VAVSPIFTHLSYPSTPRLLPSRSTNHQKRLFVADHLAQAAYGSQYGGPAMSNAPSAYYGSGSTVARWAAQSYPAPSVVASTAPSERVNSHWRWADNTLSERGVSHTGHSVYSSSHAPAYFQDVRGQLHEIA